MPAPIQLLSCHDTRLAKRDRMRVRITTSLCAALLILSAVVALSARTATASLAQPEQAQGLYLEIAGSSLRGILTGPPIVNGKTTQFSVGMRAEIDRTGNMFELRLDGIAQRPMEIMLAPGATISTIQSPSHELFVTKDQDYYRISLSQPRWENGQDLVLRWEIVPLPYATP